MKRDWKLCILALGVALVLPWFGWPLEERASRAAEVDAAAQINQPAQGPLIALTFDDGPRRSTTTQLLDGLAQRGVPATFFLIGEQIPGNEDLVRRMDAEGHQLGIHSSRRRRR